MRNLVISIFLLAPFFATAQTKQKAEAAFVAELNNILKASTQQHWAFEGYKMKIDSPYAINKNGVLSVTVSYRKANEVIITRAEAPVNKIIDVAYDLYVILDFKGEDVNTFTADKGSRKLKATEKANYLHIGKPFPEGVYSMDTIKKLLDNLLNYYKN